MDDIDTTTERPRSARPGPISPVVLFFSAVVIGSVAILGLLRQTFPALVGGATGEGVVSLIGNVLLTALAVCLVLVGTDEQAVRDKGAKTRPWTRILGVWRAPEILGALGCLLALVTAATAFLAGDLLGGLFGGLFGLLIAAGVVQLVKIRAEAQ